MMRKASNVLYSMRILTVKVSKYIPNIPDIRQPDCSLCTGDLDKYTVFNNFLAVFLLEMTAPPLNCALESIPNSSTWTQ